MPIALSTRVRTVDVMPVLKAVMSPAMPLPSTYSSSSKAVSSPSLTIASSGLSQNHAFASSRDRPTGAIELDGLGERGDAGRRPDAGVRFRDHIGVDVGLQPEREAATVLGVESAFLFGPHMREVGQGGGVAVELPPVVRVVVTVFHALDFLGDVVRRDVAVVHAVVFGHDLCSHLS